MVSLSYDLWKYEAVHKKVKFVWTSALHYKMGLLINSFPTVSSACFPYQVIDERYTNFKLLILKILNIKVIRKNLRKEHREIKLIAVTLMPYSKTRALELKMIAKDFC